MESELGPRFLGKVGEAIQVLFGDGQSAVTEICILKLDHRLTQVIAVKINSDKDSKNLSCLLEDEVDEFALIAVFQAGTAEFQFPYD